MDDVWCLMWDVRRQMSDVRCLYVWMMTDVCCQMYDMWYSQTPLFQSPKGNGKKVRNSGASK